MKKIIINEYMLKKVYQKTMKEEQEQEQEQKKQ